MKQHSMSSPLSVNVLSDDSNNKTLPVKEKAKECFLFLPHCEYVCVILNRVTSFTRFSNLHTRTYTLQLLVPFATTNAVCESKSKRMFSVSTSLWVCLCYFKQDCIIHSFLQLAHTRTYTLQLLLLFDNDGNMSELNKDLCAGAQCSSIVSIGETAEQLSEHLYQNDEKQKRYAITSCISTSLSYDKYRTQQEEGGEKISGVREERFTSGNGVCSLRPFATYSPFQISFARDLEGHFGMYEGIPDDALTILVEKAAKGIIDEGKSLGGNQVDAEKMAQRLLSVKDGKRDDIWKVCVKLYTMSNFLFKKMNEIMRIDFNQTEYATHALDKLPTFGPFVFLLQKLAPPYVDLNTIVYRGVNLSDNFIKQFNDEAVKDVRERLIFQAFTSTTRNKEVAKMFAGNSLFEICIGCLGIDIAQYSDIPDEEEVLLMPEFWCRIESCVYNETLSKWILRFESFL
jgi:hypothetical protein